MLPLQGTWPQDPGQMADHIMNKSWWREGGDWKDVTRRKEDTVNTIINGDKGDPHNGVGGWLCKQFTNEAG